MENNILVIGNGYDLAHGLKTKYDDFIEYVKNKKYDEHSVNIYADEIKRIVEVSGNGFIKYFEKYTDTVTGWVDAEKLIKNVIDQFQDFFTNYKNYISDKGGFQTQKADAAYSIFRLFGLTKQINSTTQLYECFTLDDYDKIYGLNKKAIAKKMKSELDDLIKALENYLILEVGMKQIDESKKIEQIAKINPDYVISFNYTDTYKIYGIDSEDVFHVHGSLDKNNMVLGFNDDDEKNLDFIYFKKYFQRIQKLTGYIDNDRFSYKDEKGITYGNATTVHFYGHSMDNTDGDIIRKLKKLSDGFVIYKYNQEDFEQKVINLIDVFGKEEATKLIQNGFIKFEPCSE